MASGVAAVWVPVEEMDRAVAFYRDTLGMSFLFQVPNLAFFACGEVRLMFSVAEKPEFDHPSSVIYYRVDDIDNAYASYKRAGVTFEDVPHLIAKMPDHDLWMAFLRDSEGNLLGLMCEKRPPAA